ncbi:unnamed protein product [Caenorhabditis bovis]|uniref:Uncharacterized protein n=1 Tax=Caenorhabditis bovis TaxID=2654633 RepID=A0A8S1F3B0_9PELO|nr:unnamed protein product [Caenorhabditis bovis]
MSASKEDIEMGSMSDSDDSSIITDYDDPHEIEPTSWLEIVSMFTLPSIRTAQLAKFPLLIFLMLLYCAYYLPLVPVIQQFVDLVDEVQTTSHWTAFERRSADITLDLLQEYMADCQKLFYIMMTNPILMIFVFIDTMDCKRYEIDAKFFVVLSMDITTLLFAKVVLLDCIIATEVIPSMMNESMGMNSLETEFNCTTQGIPSMEYCSLKFYLLMLPDDLMTLIITMIQINVFYTIYAFTLTFLVRRYCRSEFHDCSTFSIIVEMLKNPDAVLARRSACYI